MSRSRGFTLLEVMVAVAVFAVVAVALIGNASSSLRQAGKLQDRTIAWWLAENEMTRLRLQPRSDNDYPGAGISREVIEIADVSWDLETTIETTENEYVRRVVVTVYKESVDEPVSELVGFLGRY